MKHDLDEVMEGLRTLESQIEETDTKQKIISAVELLQTYKDERDELQVQRDNALKEAEELRRSRAEASSSHIPQFFSEFCFSDIQEATNNFDPSLKIGEGGYGKVYQGLLHHTQVAIKVLNPRSSQGPSEFQQEVTVLSRMRHPNLVTLIGACPGSWTLVYEYLPNGSLEDRLSCKGNSAPLSWQTRIRLATELCSVLMFLHSSKPDSIVHGDLKPANILLDANFVSKLSDFGICRVLRHIEGSNSTTVCRTDPKGTFAYIDPGFLATGELTSKSDVYSFGIILLRLLTGRPPVRIVKEVEDALDEGNLKDLLDPLAGDWPLELAEQLTNLALRCCEMNRKCRPDLATDVWRALEPMEASCGGSSYFRFGSEEHCQPCIWPMLDSEAQIHIFPPCTQKTLPLTVTNPTPQGRVVAPSGWSWLLQIRSATRNLIKKEIITRDAAAATTTVPATTSEEISVVERCPTSLPLLSNDDKY